MQPSQQDNIVIKILFNRQEHLLSRSHVNEKILVGTGTTYFPFTKTQTTSTLLHTLNFID